MGGTRGVFFLSIFLLPLSLPRSLSLSSPRQLQKMMEQTHSLNFASPATVISSSSFGRRQGYHDSPSQAPARHNRKREGSLTSLP